MAPQRRKDALIWGLILCAVGTLFLLQNLDIDLWDYVWKFWPLILILWGAQKLWDGLRERKERQDASIGTPPSQDRP